MPFVRVTRLSAAQINALHTTPVELVPAPSGGQVIQPVNVLFAYHYGGAVFSADTSFEAGWGADPDAQGFWGSVQLGIDAATTNVQKVLNASLAVQPSDGEPIAGLRFALGAAADNTLGNGTLVVTVVYNLAPAS